MKPLDPSSVIRVAVGPLAEHLGQEIAILDPKSGLYFGLNEVGARVWELLQEPTRLSEVADALGKEYAVDPEECQTDVLALATRMLDAGLVEVTGASAA